MVEPDRQCTCNKILRVFAYPFLPWKAVIPIHVVWQKSNETEFLLTMNFILFTNQGYPVAYPGMLFRGGVGVQQIQLRTEDRENGDLRAVAPLSGVLEAAIIWYKKFHFI